MAAREGWQPGERVFAMCDFPRRGAVAEYAVVGHQHAARVPPSVPWTEAASLPLVASTSIMAIQDTLRVRSGERVLILGGTTATGGSGPLPLSATSDSLAPPGPLPQG